MRYWWIVRQWRSDRRSAGAVSRLSRAGEFVHCGPDGKNIKDSAGRLHPSRWRGWSQHARARSIWASRSTAMPIAPVQRCEGNVVNGDAVLLWRPRYAGRARWWAHGGGNHDVE